MRINEINEIDQFFELKCEWNKVLERSQDNNPFLTWEYLSTYWKHFGKEKKLKILSIEDKDRIIAIAPLKQSRYDFANWLGYSVITPLGYPADYTGLILTERELEHLKLFLDYLFEHDDWDFIYLFDVPLTSAIVNLLPRMSKIIPKFELEEGAICPYISIPCSMNIFRSRLSGNLRRNLRKRMRKLQNDYKKVELRRYDEFSSVEKAMKLFIKLHQNRWKSRQMPGVFDTQENRDFWIDVAKLFADKEWLALYFLTANGEPIAAQYAFEYDQKIYSCLPAFNPEYNEYSPGNLLRAKIIEKCITKGIKEYDFLKGGEPYKFDWTKTYRRNLNVRIVNKKFTSNLFHYTIRTVKQTKADKILGKLLDF